MKAVKCDFGGCKCAAKWTARKLFGKGDVLKVCEKHKPDANNRPASIRHLPFCYDVQPLSIDQWHRP